MMILRQGKSHFVIFSAELLLHPKISQFVIFFCEFRVRDPCAGRSRRAVPPRFHPGRWLRGVRPQRLLSHRFIIQASAPFVLRHPPLPPLLDLDGRVEGGLVRRQAERWRFVPHHLAARDHSSRPRSRRLAAQVISGGCARPVPPTLDWRRLLHSAEPTRERWAAQRPSSQFANCARLPERT